MTPPARVPPPAIPADRKRTAASAGLADHDAARTPRLSDNDLLLCKLRRAGRRNRTENAVGLSADRCRRLPQHIVLQILEWVDAALRIAGVPEGNYEDDTAVSVTGRAPDSPLHVTLDDATGFFRHDASRRRYALFRSLRVDAPSVRFLDLAADYTRMARAFSIRFPDPKIRAIAAANFDGFWKTTRPFVRSMSEREAALAAEAGRDHVPLNFLHMTTQASVLMRGVRQIAYAGAWDDDRKESAKVFFGIVAQNPERLRAVDVQVTDPAGLGDALAEAPPSLGARLRHVSIGAARDARAWPSLARALRIAARPRSLAVQLAYAAEVDALEGVLGDARAMASLRALSVRFRRNAIMDPATDQMTDPGCGAVVARLLGPKSPALPPALHTLALYDDTTRGAPSGHLAAVFGGPATPAAPDDVPADIARRAPGLRALFLGGKHPHDEIEWPAWRHVARLPPSLEELHMAPITTHGTFTRWEMPRAVPAAALRDISALAALRTLVISVLEPHSPDLAHLAAGVRLERLWLFARPRHHYDAAVATAGRPALWDALGTLVRDGHLRDLYVDVVFSAPPPPLYRGSRKQPDPRPTDATLSNWFPPGRTTPPRLERLRLYASACGLHLECFTPHVFWTLLERSRVRHLSLLKHSLWEPLTAELTAELAAAGLSVSTDDSRPYDGPLRGILGDRSDNEEESDTEGN